MDAGTRCTSNTFSLGGPISPLQHPRIASLGLIRKKSPHIDEYNASGYSTVIYQTVPHRRTDGSCPYEECARDIYYSGRKVDAAKIGALVNLLSRSGSQQFVVMRKAEEDERCVAAATRPSLHLPFGDMSC